MATRPLSEVWCLTIQERPPTDAVFRLSVPGLYATNATTEFVDLWQKLAFVGALRIDATPLRLVNLSAENFR